MAGAEGAEEADRRLREAEIREMEADVIRANSLLDRCLNFFGFETAASRRLTARRQEADRIYLEACEEYARNRGGERHGGKRKKQRTHRRKQKKQRKSRKQQKSRKQRKQRRRKSRKTHRKR